MNKKVFGLDADYNILLYLRRAGLLTVESHLKALMIIGSNVRNIVLPRFEDTMKLSSYVKNLQQRLENVICKEYAISVKNLKIFYLKIVCVCDITEVVF